MLFGYIYTVELRQLARPPTGRH